MEQYFKLLNLPKHSSRKAIKQAYRQLAHLWHPDKFVDKSPLMRELAERRFLEIKRAFEQLWSASLPQADDEGGEETDDLAWQPELLAESEWKKNAAAETSGRDLLQLWYGSLDRAPEAVLRTVKKTLSKPVVVKLPPQTGSNKRKFPRMEMRLGLVVVHESAGRLHEVFSDDLTIEGISFRVERPLPVSSRMYVEFPAQAHLRRHRVYAQIIRCVTVPDSDPPLYRIVAKYIFGANSRF
jgi:hypothetical protein